MQPRVGGMLVGVLVLSLWTATASGQPARGLGWNGMGGPGSWAGGPMLPLLLRGVSLTDAQEAQVRQIVATHRPQFQTLLSQMRAAQEQLTQKLYAPGAVTATDLDPLRQQIGQLRDQLTQEGLQIALEVRGVLTPEQLAKAAQIRQRVTDLQAELRSLLRGGP